MKKIILASTSPRRKDILHQIGLDFDIIPSSYEEDMSLSKTPEDLVQYLAEQKGKVVAQQQNTTAAVIISSDTIVAIDGNILGKPQSREEAKNMLRLISNRTHDVYSGVCVIDTETNDQTVFYSSAKITMRELSEEEIEAYIETGEPMDKAGAYGIQGMGGMFIQSIEGDYYAIVGLPIEQLVLVLRQYGIEILI